MQRTRSCGCRCCRHRVDVLRGVERQAHRCRERETCGQQDCGQHRRGWTVQLARDGSPPPRGYLSTLCSGYGNSCRFCIEPWPQPDIERLYSAAMFHDIGKAKIPLAVLDKPGRLDTRERALIETHPAAGFDVLKGNP